MLVEIYESDTSYTMRVKYKGIDRGIAYNIDLLGRKGALLVAESVAKRVKAQDGISLEEFLEFLNQERKKRDYVYMEQGRGITEVSQDQCYTVYFRYVDGLSPNYRIAFGKRLLGKDRAYSLAKKFCKEFYDLENTIGATNQQVEDLVMKYELIKQERQLEKNREKRMRQLKEYRQK